MMFRAVDMHAMKCIPVCHLWLLKGVKLTDAAQISQKRVCCSRLSLLCRPPVAPNSKFQTYRVLQTLAHQSPSIVLQLSSQARSSTQTSTQESPRTPATPGPQRHHPPALRRCAAGRAPRASMPLPAAPAGAPRAAAGARALRAPARICALAGKPGRARRQPRAPTRVAGLSPQRRERSESAWAHELRPGNEAARPPALHYDNIGTTALPERAGLEWRRRSRAMERLLGPWERLESRYKMVIATSAAFVLCNMVRPAFRAAQRRGRAGQRGRKGGGGARACHPPAKVPAGTPGLPRETLMPACKGFTGRGGGRAAPVWSSA